MSLRPIYISIIITLLLTVTYGCSDDSVSLPMSPEQVVQAFFQSINNRDCERNISLLSTNKQKKAGKNHADAIKACKQSVSEGAPTANVKNISEVYNDGNKAEVKYQLNFSNVNYESPILNGTDILIMEDGEWKIDEVNSVPDNGTKT